MNPSEGAPASAYQLVRAEAGHAYGAIGADIHVFGDGTPVYLLFEHHRIPAADPEWQRAQPSRMLDARAEVVDFTGRDTEWNELVEWSRTGPKFRVRWLHGEGGQGKTRLANRLASLAQSSEWKAANAVHGTDAHPPAKGSQDLRLDGRAGILLLVDYADRWPVSDLSWLLQNRLLRQAVPTRVLLIARSARGWPAVQGILDKLRDNIDTSDQELPPLPGESGDRECMFTAARDCFARCYPAITRSADIRPPKALEQPDFGLTLAVHMAALAAVDAEFHGHRAPTDMAGLTTYLLHREQENWQQLYENQDAGLNYRTPTETMARIVFAATLIGATSRKVALRLPETLDIRLPPRVTSYDLLSDHATCYRPTDPSGSDVLEPLRPDRLAEDFLALSLEGSPISGHPIDPWGTTAIRKLLEAGSERAAPPWNRRVLIFLAATAERWPHVGDRHLYPILNASPQIAVEAGNSALTAIAAMKDIPARTLATVEQALPADQTLGLDSGAAAVTDKFARRIPSVWVEDRLSGQSRFYGTYARRLAAAGRTNEAITVAWHAVNALDITERVTGKRLTSEDDLSSKAEALNVYSVALGGARQWPKALEASQEAMDIIIGLVRKNPSRHLPAAATVMANYAYALSGQGRTDEALDYSRATRDLWYLLAMKSGSGEYVESLARAAHNHANKLGEADRYDEALRHYEFAIRLREELIRHDRAVYIVDLAGSTLIHAKLALDMGHHDVALASGRRAVELLEEMVAADRGIHLPTLMGAVTNYSIMLRSAGRQSDAARYAQRSTELEEELLTSTPNTHNLAELTEEMSHLALWREQEGQFPEALEYSQRAVRLAEHLTSSESFYRPTLVRNLTVFACIRARTDRDLDAANQAADRVANILTEESPNIPQERREEFAVTYAEMFSLLGRPDDADQISRQILDNSITTKPRPPKEYTSQPELDANFHRRVADSLEYILESIQRDVSNNDEG